MASTSSDLIPGFNPAYARTNPYRPWPSDPKYEETLTEILYIEETLNHGMLPTSLPDDDYPFYSALLRSLETRNDMTWLIAHETNIFEIITRIAEREGPLPREPEELRARTTRLSQYWEGLKKQASAPNKWDPEFDTWVIPPLIYMKSPKKLTLTPYQLADAQKRCTRHLRIRVRYVSRFMDNPPEPVEFIPVPRNFVINKTAWLRLYTNEELPETERQERDVELRFRPVYLSVNDQCHKLPFKKEDVTEQDMMDLQADFELRELRGVLRSRRITYQDQLAEELGLDDDVD